MTYCSKSALNLQLLDNFMLTEENDFHSFNSMCSGELCLTLSTEYFIASSEMHNILLWLTSRKIQER